MFKKGDTLVEVCIAIGIFSLIAIGVASVMSSGTAGSETALETTLTREEIDAQADALRFVHESYMNAKNSASDPSSDPYYVLWSQITEKAVDASSSVTQYNPQSCNALYDKNAENNIFTQHAFILNTKQLSNPAQALISSTNSLSTDVFQPTTTYPRLIFGNSTNNTSNSSIIDPTLDANTNLYRAEGVYAIAVKDGGTGMIMGNDRTAKTEAFYDFYIRSCWYGVDSDRPTAISTVIRLYDPPTLDSNEGEGANRYTPVFAKKYVRIQFYASTSTNPNYTQPYTFTRIPAGDSDRLIDVSQSNQFKNYKSRFLCWGTNKTNCNGEHYASGQMYSVPADLPEKKFLNLYAIWNTNPYTVTFNANGGKYSNNATTKSESCAPFAACEVSYTIPSGYFGSGAPTRSGYSFLGWSTKSNASTAQYTSSSAKYGNLTGNVTLYAVWKPYYYITYNANGGVLSGNVGSRTDSCAPIASCANSYSIPSSYFSGLSRSGYSFLGWSTNSRATSPTYTSSSTKIGKLTGNVTLYAVWKPYYYITYNANGGVLSGNVGSKTDSCAPIASCANSYSIPSSYFSGLSRSGYSFLGWSTNSRATSPTYTSSSAKIGKLTGNVTLYAVWKSYYYITYNSGQGDFSNGAKTKTDSCAPIASCANSYSVPSSYFGSGANAPTRSGYRFLGWSTVNNSSTAKYTSSAPKYGRLTGNITLYAAWAEQNETITIRANWSSSRDYDSFLKLSKPDGGGYIDASYSTSQLNVTYGGKTYSLATGVGDGRGASNGVYYESFVINTLGGKNYYYSITKYDPGWPNGVGSDITVTITGPYLGTVTYRSSAISCPGGYWNVFAYKNGRIVTRNTCTSSIEYGY